MLGLVDEAEPAVAVVTGPKPPLSEFGRLLHESGKIKPHSKNTNPTLDKIYEAGLSAGALGRKLLGAGSSGFMALFIHLSGGRLYARD
jgi:D-glycero-alpha-D-manno-heptose-7-phosphate kinase